MVKLMSEEIAIIKEGLLDYLNDIYANYMTYLKNNIKDINPEVVNNIMSFERRIKQTINLDEVEVLKKEMNYIEESVRRIML